MSFSSDDLTPLLTPGRQPDAMRFGQGIIRSWDPLTARNTVEYRGALLTDLPILGGIEALLLGPGTVVGIAAVGRQLFILGRITVPGSPQAADALNALRIYSGTVTNLGFTSSTTFTDLDSPDPGGPVLTDVLVGPSGRVLVFLTAFIADGFTGTSQSGGDMGVAVTGATTVAVSAVDTLGFTLYSSDAAQERIDGQLRATALQFIDGLNPGLHTFTAKYAARVADPCAFFNRNLTAIPF
jgi:hypothetical protein